MDDPAQPPQCAFDEVITRVLSRFSTSPPSEIGVHIEAGLREIAEYVGVQYAFVVRASADLSRWSLVYEWCAPNVSSKLTNYQDVPMGTFHWTEKVLLAGEVLLMNRLDEIPASAADVRQRIETLGFKSTVQVPMRSPGGCVSGCIGLSSLVREIDWTPADVRRLKLVGEAIANAMERFRVENELRKSGRAREELSQRRALIVAASLDGLWEWDTRTDRVQYSDRFAELLGYDLSEVPPTAEFFHGIMHPDDAQDVWDAVERHLAQGDPYDAECRLRLRDGQYRWFRTRGLAQRDLDGQPVWMAGSLQDIHEQKSAEQKLRGALEEVERLTYQLRAENTYLQEEIADSLGFDEIVGESDALRSVLAQVEHVALTDASVLLLGETGTGKELLARAIHDRSARKDRSFVKVNLAAIPASLIESELFGHVKGAFSGAIRDRRGRFQLADGGTLFLDEIGELDVALQTKLLHVLQEGEFERLGSAETLRVDVRIVAATNRNLRRAMEQGRFRPDLYYRLAVFPIEVPPLRLRKDDIPLLTWHFIGKKQGRLGKRIQRVPEGVMQALVEYDWPGNLRELENVIERAMILASSTELRLIEPLTQSSFRPGDPGNGSTAVLGRAEIVSALEASCWKIKGVGNAAERLGMKPSTLRYRMKVLDIRRPEAS